MATPPIAILGAGLAGLTLAASLLEQGYPAAALLVIDGRQPGAGMAPGMLLNPLTGRSLAPKPGYLEAFRFARQWLLTLAAISGQPLWQECPLLRPVLSPDFAVRFARSLARSQPLLSGQLKIRLLGREELLSEFPLSAAFDSCYVVAPVYSVAVPRLLGFLQERLRQAGVNFAFGQPVRGIEPVRGGWRLLMPEGSLDTPRLVLANGAGLKAFLPGLPLETLAGSLLVLQAAEDLPFATSAAGHLAPLPGRQWVSGSSFFPPDQPLTPTEDEALLRQQAQRLVPAAAALPTAALWTGIRAIYAPDRLPLVGALPGHPGLYLFSALAATGLLWIPTLADQLARHLTSGEPVQGPYAAGRLG